MPDETRPYVLDSDEEPMRLEAQAELAGIEKHLDHFDLPRDARVLDAGCGSGSMARLMAKHVPDGHVTGVDANEKYLDFARRAAAHEGIENISFTPGDVLAYSGQAERQVRAWRTVAARSDAGGGNHTLTCSA